MNEHDMDEKLRSWARSSAEQPAPAELRRQVLEVPDTEASTRQRRWLWFLPGPKPTAGADAEQGHERPAPPTPRNGGTRTMFSATKMVGIAAAIALFGALTLALPASRPQEAEPLAAVAELGEITPFTSEVRILGQDRAANAERFDWGSMKLGEQWTTRATASDPRVSGVATVFQNVYEVGADKMRIQVYTGRLFTKEGSWLESGRAYQNPETTGLHIDTYSVGEGAHEGLFAVTSCSQEQFSAHWDCEGVIVEGGWPGAPNDAPDEIPAIHGGP